MDHQRLQKAASRSAARSGTYDIVVETATLNHSVVAARFPQGIPAGWSEAQSFRLGFDKAASKASNDSSLVLARCPEGSKGAAKDSRHADECQWLGVPHADISNCFVLSKVMHNPKQFMLEPLTASHTFRPLSKSPVLSIEEVEAAMNAPATRVKPMHLVPKSVRQELQEAAAVEALDRQLQQEVEPLLDKEKVAELSAKHGAAASTGRPLDRHNGDDGDDDAWGTGTQAGARKRGPGKDKRGPKAAGQARRGAGGQSGVDIPEDELPEDIYAGEEDELRPAAPTEDVDWEFDEGAADDDLEQGASDEEGLADDPGYRKQLGLDADDEDAEEEAKKQAGLAAEEGEEAQKDGTDAAADGAAQAQGAAAQIQAAAAAGPSQGSAGGSVESEGVEDVLDDDDEEFDAEALDRLAAEHELEGRLGQPVKRRKGSVGPASRERSPGPSRLATPPPGTAAAAGSSRATPPPGAGRRAGTPPVGPWAVTAAAGAVRQQAAGARHTPPPDGSGRRASPPGAGPAAAKRKRDESSGRSSAAAAAASTANAAGGAAGRGYKWRPDQLDDQGVPTVECMAQALSEMGPITTGQLHLLQENLDVARIGDEGKKLLKQRMLAVAKVEVINGVKYVVLKNSTAS